MRVQMLNWRKRPEGRLRGSSGESHRASGADASFGGAGVVREIGVVRDGGIVGIERTGERAASQAGGGMVPPPANGLSSAK